MRGEHDERAAEREGTERDEPRLAEAPRQRADQPSLDARHHEPGEAQQQAGFARPVAASRLEEEGEGRLGLGRGEGQDEEQQDRDPRPPVAERLADRRAVERSPVLLPQRGVERRLGQLQPREEAGRERHRRRDEHRRAVAPVRKQPADRRTEDEAEAEAGADHAHAAGAALLGGDVGDVRRGRREVRAADAGERAADEEPGERGREAEHQQRGSLAEDRRHQDRPAGRARRTAGPRRGANTSCIAE